MSLITATLHGLRQRPKPLDVRRWVEPDVLADVAARIDSAFSEVRRLSQLARSLAVTFADVTQGVYAPVHCDVCKATRARIGHEEVAVLIEEHELPCPCGEVQVYVGGAGLAEAVGL